MTSCLGSKNSTAELQPQLTILSTGTGTDDKIAYCGGISVNSFFAILALATNPIVVKEFEKEPGRAMSNRELDSSMRGVYHRVKTEEGTR